MAHTASLLQAAHHCFFPFFQRSFAKAVKHPQGIQQKEQEVTHRSFDHKCNALRKQHDKSAQCGAIQKKSRPYNDQCRKTNLSAVGTVEQQHQENPDTNTVKQILTKNDQSQKAPLPVRLMPRQKRQLNTTETLCQTVTVLYP